jgi:hypothetical protein
VSFDASKATQLGLGLNEQYVVSSHPCDVVALDLDKEPSVELFLLKVIEKIDGNFSFGKNPRRLHVEINGCAFEIDVATRRAISRSELAAVHPTFTLVESDRKMFAAWIASRYSRPVFSDTFNARMNPASRRIQRAMKSKGQYLSGIYVATHLAELEDGEAYPVIVAATMRAEDFGTPDRWADASEAVEEVEAALADISGVDLRQIDLISEAGMTLESLRTFARWDYDALSFKTGDVSTTPPAA